MVSINQFIVVRAGSETTLSVLRAGVKGGTAILLMTLLDPVDTKLRLRWRI